MKRYLFFILSLLFLSHFSHAQFYSVKTNTLAWATGTMNAGVELALEKQWSLDISLYYNPIKGEKIKTSFMAFQPGVRYWIYEHFVGHFVASHITYGAYDIGNDRWHYQGWLLGPGVSYGYTWILRKRLNLTVEGGIGVFYLTDKRNQYQQDRWKPEVTSHYKRFVLSPSKMEISFSYLF